MQDIISQLEGYDFIDNGSSVAVRDGSHVRAVAYMEGGNTVITEYGKSLGLGESAPKRRSRKAVDAVEESPE